MGVWVKGMARKSLGTRQPQVVDSQRRRSGPFHISLELQTSSSGLRRTWRACESSQAGRWRPRRCEYGEIGPLVEMGTGGRSRILADRGARNKVPSAWRLGCCNFFQMEIARQVVLAHQDSKLGNWEDICWDEESHQETSRSVEVVNKSPMDEHGWVCMSEPPVGRIAKIME